MLSPQCVICVNSKATMQTWPCGHRVVCRKCLVRTIQIAVSRRSLPLRCVVCRARVLRLKRSTDARTAASTASANGRRNSTTAPASRSHSLPTKLRRHATTVAVRSRSVGTGKTCHRRQSTGRRVNYTSGGTIGWPDVFATDDEGEDGRDDQHTSAVKYRLGYYLY